jgi:hypothetical protein
MPSRMARALYRREEGSALLIAVILSSVVATLSVLMLSVGVHTDKASARGRHWVQALDVAESGVERAMAKIQTADGNYSGTFSGSTPEGTYSVVVTRQSRNSYTIDATGAVRAGQQLNATRKLQVKMSPPVSFKNALFSFTTVQTKNGDDVSGDIWANQNVIVASGTTVSGSITAATGYVVVDGGASVGGDAWSGGFNPATNNAILLENNASVDGLAKASVTNPPDPITCGGASTANYKVQLNGGASVGGDVTTWGTKTGAGTVGGTVHNNNCTPAPATVPMPSFSYSANNYDASTLHQYGTPATASATAVSDFQAYMSAHGNQISGTFYLNQTSPVNQNVRVDLTGVTIVGDTTIITNTPVFTNNTTDDTSDAVVVLVSTYSPPVGTSCDLTQDKSECAVHLKNNFQTSGNTALLVYTPYGPVAVKNNAVQYGAVYADSIQIKNNEALTYDSRIERIVGFGQVTLEVTKWLEVKA